jgi:hypothetical protein
MDGTGYLTYGQVDNVSPLQDLSPSPRRIIRSHSTEDFTGFFPLYDLLHLSTQSGNIDIIVEPQPADPEHPDEPARVVLTTDSGFVNVMFGQDGTTYKVTFDNGEVQRIEVKRRIDSSDGPADPGLEILKNVGVVSVEAMEAQIPYRPYAVDVYTKSGAIRGKFIFTSELFLQSVVGDIEASLVPVLPRDAAAAAAAAGNVTIVTKTRSGSQRIALLEPFVFESEEEEKVFSSSGTGTATHISEAGNLHFTYPHSWAGNVTALHASWGSISVGGRDLKITENTFGLTKAFRPPADDEDSETPDWWGSRGDMDVVLKQEAGDIDFRAF